jgi:hypothetical protein
MVPWRVAQGERLYADVEFHHGPLAPYVAAAADRLFGRSLPARTALAGGIALLHLAALARLSRRMLAPWRAALATSIAVASALFLRPGGWLFPFSFDAAIAIAAITWALELSARGEKGPDGLAGACLAAALLARLEIGLVAVAVLAFAARAQPRRILRLALWPLLASTAGYAVASVGIPFPRLEAEGWLRLLDPPEAFRNVYRAYAGLDRAGLRSAELLLSALLLLLAAAVLGTASLVASRLRSRGIQIAVETMAVAVLAVAAAVRLRPPAALAETAELLPPLVRAVPLIVVAAALARLAVRLAGRAPRGSFADVPDAVLWIGALFAARLLLAAGYVGPYDAFFLPLPLTVAVAALFGISDRAAEALGAALPRLTAAAVVLFLLFRVAAMADFYRRPGWTRVETAAGPLVLPEPVAETTRLALADLTARFSANSTVAGYPEAGFFNYVLGRRNPFPHEQYFPGHLDAAGQDQAAAAFAARPPDAALYANVLAVGEGARSFGKDYLEKLDVTIRSRTRPVAVYGPGAREGARIGDPGFFVEIRVPAAAADNPAAP